jgi:ABC-type glycerol-3-phosphate transport system substrate-binding protein
VKYAKELLRYALDPFATGWVEAAVQFAQGKSPQTLNFHGLWPIVVAPDSAVKDVAVPSQYPKVVSHPNQLSGLTLLIPKYAKNKWAAWSFITWATSKRIQQQLWNAGQPTNRMSVIKNPVSAIIQPAGVVFETPLFEAKDPGSKAEQVAGTDFPRLGSDPDQVRAIMEKYVSQAIAGQISVEECVKNATAEVDQYSKEQGLLK